MTTFASRIRQIDDVVDHHLCTGCGACAHLLPESIRMVDDVDHGSRPVTIRGANTAPALAVCPGLGLTRDETGDGSGEISELRAGWGSILEMWEGHATDPDIRFAGSSGGAASALALHAISRGSTHGVLHIRSRRDIPYLNETVLSTSRAEILAATGSRYAPASPCDRLDLVEAAEEPSVFIGKPCDVAALAMLRRIRPELDRKIGLTIAIFCAGTPSTRGTLDMLDRVGVASVHDVVSVRYRGNGWPGRAEVQVAQDDGSVDARYLSYEDSWGDTLQMKRQWRCYVCADHTGEFADIAVGDPWYQEIPDGEPGQSLVLARTERGLKAVESAIADGYLTLRNAPAAVLPASQENLLRASGSAWGRSITTRALGLGGPRYRGFGLLATWWRELTPWERIQSVIGTVKRIRTRRLFQPESVLSTESEVRR